MADMINLQTPMDRQLRDDARELFNKLGLDTTTAIRMFFRQCINDQALPFKPKLDPVYSPEHVAYLQKIMADIQAGKNVAAHALIED